MMSSECDDIPLTTPARPSQPSVESLKQHHFSYFDPVTMTKIASRLLFAMTVLRFIQGTSGFVARLRPTFHSLNGGSSGINRRCTRTKLIRSLANSVSKIVYTAAEQTTDSSTDTNTPTVKLFTKEGCTLCDKVKDVLEQVREQYPHTLIQVDITDDEHTGWFSKYKYDIPVLHLDDKFWIKHRTTHQEVMEGFSNYQDGTFQERKGEPDAGALERRQAERENRK